MRILYLQLGLQIDYIYDCYNNKQFTFHLQHKKTKNGKRRLHNTFIYIQKAKGVSGSIELGFTIVLVDTT